MRVGKLLSSGGNVGCSITSHTVHTSTTKKVVFYVLLHVSVSVPMAMRSKA